MIMKKYVHTPNIYNARCINNNLSSDRGVGSIKRLGGGHRFQGHFGILKRAPKKFFPEMLATGGIFPSYQYRNCTFLTKFFLKTWKFPNKKDTFEVNLVLFTATLACTKRALFITKKGTFYHKKGHFLSQKRALFITKKGTFSPFKKLGGGTCPPCPPPVPTPLSSDWIGLRILTSHRIGFYKHFFGSDCFFHLRATITIRI